MARGDEAAHVGVTPHRPNARADGSVHAAPRRRHSLRRARLGCLRAGHPGGSGSAVADAGPPTAGSGATKPWFCERWWGASCFRVKGRNARKGQASAAAGRGGPPSVREGAWSGRAGGTGVPSRPPIHRTQGTPRRRPPSAHHPCERGPRDGDEAGARPEPPGATHRAPTTGRCASMARMARTRPCRRRRHAGTPAR